MFFDSRFFLYKYITLIYCETKIQILTQNMTMILTVFHLVFSTVLFLFKFYKTKYTRASHLYRIFEYKYNLMTCDYHLYNDL